MKRLGVVKNIMRDGSLLLKATEEIPLGTVIYNARGDKIGTAARVFGPVSAPYVTIKSKQQGAKSLNLLESEAYFDPTRVKGGRKKRGRAYG